MKIKDIIKFKNNEVISIVGAGGKTSLMNLLAKEISLDENVLITTSTKIYKPNKNDVDYLYLNYEELISNLYKKNSIFAYGSNLNSDNKLIGIKLKEIKDLKKYFNKIVIEADGSKCKDLKAWNESEPVISNDTTITLGVLSLSTVGMEINDENIHRLEIFKGLIKDKNSTNVDLNILIQIIFNENGLFKNSNGRRILFLNKLDKYNNDIDIFLKLIKENNKDKLIEKVIYGSLKENKFNYIDL